MISVEVIRGPDKGRVYQLAADGIIGRQSESLALADGTVSRHHARLGQRDGEWVIEDVGSVNGTFVNGVRVNRPTRLQQGDQIRCGTTLLVFGGSAGKNAPPVDVDESGKLMDASIMATIPAGDDSVIIPTPEAGAEAIDNLRILYRLTTAVSSIFELDLLCQRTLDMVVEVVHADRAFIILVGDKGKLTTQAARNAGEAMPPGNDRIPVSRTIINEVVTKQIGILSSNAMRDKRFSAGKSVHDFGIRSALCVPIKGRDKAIGVIHVDSSVSEYTYSTEQLRLLTAIGYQTGLAMENVRLFEANVKGERLAAMGETAAALSHHIKNILQGLSGGSELVEKALEQGNLPRAKQAWPIVRRSLARINGVILNMLAFSKDRQPLMETLNINPIVQECVDLMASDADDRSVAVLTDLGDLPPVPADPGGLHQIMLNLLTNALDAVTPGAGVVTVSTDYDTMLRTVTLKVADNGVGIPDEQMANLFEAFHSTKGQKGTGLGLAVTRKIVAEHGGKISVDSQPGKGTTFTITLQTSPGGLPGDTFTP